MAEVVKTPASSEGGMEFKFRANQITHTLPATRYCCNLEVWIPLPRNIANWRRTTLYHNQEFLL